jgi:hypothetical protein
MTIGSLATVTLDAGSVVVVTGFVVVVTGFVVVVTGFVVVVPGFVVVVTGFVVVVTGFVVVVTGFVVVVTGFVVVVTGLVVVVVGGVGGAVTVTLPGVARHGRNRVTGGPADLQDLDRALGRAKGDRRRETVHQDARQSVGRGRATEGREVGRDVGSPRGLLRAGGATTG